MKKISNQLITLSRKAGKTYHFDDRHDKTLPAEMWFQESGEGMILFIVFYTLACRWSRCIGCNLPSKSSPVHIDYKTLMRQIDNLFEDPGVVKKRESIRKVIISNNGSILDQDTFSSTALMYLLARLNLNFPNLSVLSIESRPEYVEFAELEFIARALAEGELHTQLEIAIGFEAFDDRVRNDVFNKGLSIAAFERLVSDMAPFGYRLKCYFMQKPVPGMTDAEAVEDIKNAIDYLSSISETHGIDINMHLNPTFVASETPLAEAFYKGDYTPPRLQDVAEAARNTRDKPISIFIGLSDEGLAVKGGSFLRKGEEAIVARLETFNRTRDYSILDDICVTDTEHRT